MNADRFTDITTGVALRLYANRDMRSYVLYNIGALSEEATAEANAAMVADVTGSILLWVPVVDADALDIVVGLLDNWTGTMRDLLVAAICLATSKAATPLE